MDDLMIRHHLALLFLALTSALTPTSQAQISVLTLGVKGDGTTDDTAAIEQAIHDHGSVSFPRGTYRLTRTVQIPLGETGFAALSGDGTARIVMAGSGPAFFFKGSHEGSAAPSSFKPPVWEKERSPMVSGIEIVGGHAEADGI